MIRYASGQNGFQIIEKNIPLETLVEAEIVPINLKSCILFTTTWKKLLKSKGIPDTIFSDYLVLFPFDSSKIIGSNNESVISNIQSSNLINVYQSKILDGVSFIKYIELIQAETDLLSYVNTTLISISDFNSLSQEILESVLAFKNWYKELYASPIDNKSWKPERLEYKFDLMFSNSDGTTTILAADEYQSGNPDWEIFTIKEPSGKRPKPLPSPTNNYVEKTLIVSEVEYPGMPNKRYWTFENGQLNYGRLNVNTTDLATLVFAEFGLLYSNDWMIIPFKVPVGSLCEVESLVITDNFGFKTNVRAAQEVSENWGMFNLDSQISAVDKRIILPPVTYRTQEGKPLEK